MVFLLSHTYLATCRDITYYVTQTLGVVILYIWECRPARLLELFTGCSLITSLRAHETSSFYLLQIEILGVE